MWSTPSDFPVQKLVDENDWNVINGAGGDLIMLHDALTTVSGSSTARALDTVYQNTTGRPKMSTMAVNYTIIGTIDVSMRIGPTTPPLYKINQFKDLGRLATDYASVIGCVPPSWYYTVSGSAAAGSVRTNYEWNLFAT